MQSERSLFIKKFTAIAIGNVMEMFDFAAFGTLADVIGSQFFPPNEPSMQLLQSLVVFGAAFVMRPLGGIIMGWIGDTMGRKRALEISIALMLFPSFLIGCLPNYNQVGWIATFFLIMLRMMQGLAVGGEMIGAFVFTIEATNGQNRGFWGACCKATGNFGASLGIGLGTLLRLTLSESQLHSWGWRVPFLLGLFFGAAGIKLRATLNKESSCEGEEFKTVQANHEVVKNPLALAIRTHYREIATVGLVCSFWCVVYYSTFVWLVYFMSDPELVGGEAVPYVWLMAFFMNLLLVGALPACGYVGDVLGRFIQDEEQGFRVTMQLGLLFAIASTIPAFMCVITRTIPGTLFGLLLLLIPASLFGSNLPAFMISQFAPNLRYSAVGVAYNFANAIFSSTAAIVQTALVLSGQNADPSSIDRSSHTFDTDYRRLLLSDGRMRPAYYIIAVALLSYIALTVCVDLNKKRRDEQNAKVIADLLPSAPTLASDDGDETHPYDHLQYTASSKQNSMKGRHRGYSEVVAVEVEPEYNASNSIRV